MHSETAAVVCVVVFGWGLSRAPGAGAEAACAEAGQFEAAAVGDRLANRQQLCVQLWHACLVLWLVVLVACVVMLRCGGTLLAPGFELQQQLPIPHKSGAHLLTRHGARVRPGGARVALVFSSVGGRGT